MATAIDWSQLPGLQPIQGSTPSNLNPFGSLAPASNADQLSRSGGSGVNWGTVGQAGAIAAPLLATAFAPSIPNITGDVNTIRGNAQTENQQGHALAAKGTSTLDPALRYFQQLLSGDPGTALSATQPDRARVIDQYDAARKAIATTTPRGGGSASTINKSRFQEASDLGNLTATARNNAANTSASLGLDLSKTGLTAEQQSQQILAETLSPMLNQESQDTASTWKTVGSIAAIAAMFL